jgi:hypothetical protein
MIDKLLTIGQGVDLYSPLLHHDVLSSYDRIIAFKCTLIFASIR